MSGDRVGGSAIAAAIADEFSTQFQSCDAAREGVEMTMSCRNVLKKMLIVAKHMDESSNSTKRSRERGELILPPPPSNRAFSPLTSCWVSSLAPTLRWDVVNDRAEVAAKNELKHYKSAVDCTTLASYRAEAKYLERDLFRVCADGSDGIVVVVVHNVVSIAAVHDSRRWNLVKCDIAPILELSSAKRQRAARPLGDEVVGMLSSIISSRGLAFGCYCAASVAAGVVLELLRKECDAIAAENPRTFHSDSRKGGMEDLVLIGCAAAALEIKWIFNDSKTDITMTVAKGSSTTATPGFMKTVCDGRQLKLSEALWSILSPLVSQ